MYCDHMVGLDYTRVHSGHPVQFNIVLGYVMSIKCKQNILKVEISSIPSTKHQYQPKNDMHYTRMGYLVISEHIDFADL